MSAPASPLTVLTGASSGLGAALAPLLARDGERVVLAARRLDSLEALAARIREAGGTAHAIELDVADAAQVRAALAQVAAAHGPIDRLICNAGIGDNTPVESLDVSAFRRIFETNFFGVLHCIEAVVPAMIARRSGHIVGVSSLAGYRGLPGSGAYSASKAALTNLLESFRIELRGHGVDVTTMSPGFVKTPMTARNRHPMPFIMEVEDAAEIMHGAIRDRDTHCAFPWQLASVVRGARLLPDALYDRALAKRRATQGPPVSDTNRP